MNKTGICPKCGSGDIVRFDGFAGDYGSGSHIKTGMTNLSAVPLNQYICCVCGYTEHWVDTVDIPKIVSSKKARRKSFN